MTAAAPVQFQSDASIMIYNLTASILHEILRQNILPLPPATVENLRLFQVAFNIIHISNILGMRY